MSDIAHELFLELVRDAGLPEPRSKTHADGELEFVKAAGVAAPGLARDGKGRPRKWRWDYAWLDQMIAIERDGGVFTRGRHSRGRGQIEDMCKHNAGVALGWRILRFTPDQMCSGLPIRWLITLGLGENSGDSGI